MVSKAQVLRIVGIVCLLTVGSRRIVVIVGCLMSTQGGGYGHLFSSFLSYFLA